MDAQKRGRLAGTVDAGACGTIPVVQFHGRKPRLRNNGYNCYAGQPEFSCEGLADALRPQSVSGMAQGHCRLEYADGSHWMAYVAERDLGLFAAW